MRRKLIRLHKDSPLHWLPFDSRLLPPLFSFGNVRGIAKVFLILEMVLAMGVVIGTFALVMVKIWLK